MAKPRIALYWAASCGGCEVAVLDINEKILDVATVADIVFWPIALDSKYHHVEAMEDRAVDLCLFNGTLPQTLTEAGKSKEKLLDNLRHFERPFEQEKDDKGGKRRWRSSTP